MTKKISIYALLSFYSIFGFILLFLSLIYILSNNVYIIEQGLYSHFNDSLLYFIPFLLIFILALFIFSVSTKISSIKVYLINKNAYNAMVLAISILLLMLYINIIISGNIPILSDGYISRFDYLHTTKLWKFLYPFGAVAVIIPITLGYLFLQGTLQNYLKKIIVFIFILYLLYVILIGQKFGALLLAIYYFILPITIHKLINNKKILDIKILFIFVFAFLFILLLVLYHYTHLPIAEEFGGPVNFIIYRLFGLQGHTFWGIIEQLDTINKSIYNWWDGMHTMMRIIGVPGIENAIARGVNFTGGYPVVLLISFSLIESILIYTALTFLFFTFLKFLLSNIYNLKYIVYAYILVYLNTFQSIGSLNILLSYKVLVLFFILATIKIIPKHRKG